MQEMKLAGREMLPRLSSGLLRLGLAVLALVGLAHASSTVDRPRATVVPSWITPLSLDGTSQEGVIGTPDDEDYFRIEVTEATDAAIYTTGGLDGEGTLLDSEGREIASNTYGGEGFTNFRIEVLLWPGDYYVRVAPSPFASDSTGSYNLHAEGTPLSAAELSFGTTPHDGAIQTGEDADYFRVAVTEVTQAVIYTTGGLDSRGTLFDSEGREIASDDDGDEATNFRMAALLWPGDYYVRVTPYSSGTTGSYNLHAEGTAVSAVELSLGGSPHDGAIETGEDADYFSFAVTEVTQAVIYTTGDLDSEGTLLDSEGREIASDDDGGELLNFRIESFLRPGDYYVRVAPSFFASLFGSDTTGSYNLHAEETALSAVELSLGGSPHNGAIVTGEEADYFSFAVTEVTQAVIYTTGGLDGEGTLLDSEGREIASDDDGGELLNFRIESLLWPGDYYVQVAPSFLASLLGSDTTGSYNLHAEGTALSAVELSLGGSSQSGAIATGENEDYYRIAVTEPTTAVIYTTGGLDTAGVLHDPDGGMIKWNDDGGEQFINFRIATVLFRSGEYIVRVFSSSGDTGSYTMHGEGNSGATQGSTTTAPGVQPAPPPFEPQSVVVALGEDEPVTLMTTADGGFTLNGEAFTSGSQVISASGPTYTLTLVGGTWTAALVTP